MLSPKIRNLVDYLVFSRALAWREGVSQVLPVFHSRRRRTSHRRRHTAERSECLRDGQGNVWRPRDGGITKCHSNDAKSGDGRKVFCSASFVTLFPTYRGRIPAIAVTRFTRSPMPHDMLLLTTSRIHRRRFPDCPVATPGGNHPCKSRKDYGTATPPITARRSCAGAELAQQGAVRRLMRKLLKNGRAPRVLNRPGFSGGYWV